MNRKQRRFAASNQGKKMAVSVEKKGDKEHEEKTRQEAIAARDEIMRTKAASELAKKQANRGSMQQLEEADRAERLQKILTGRIAPPNEMVDYLVAQLRKVIAEIDQVSRNLQQAKAAAEQAEARARELRGMRIKYLEDIRHWDKPEEVTDKKVEDAA